MADLQRLGQEQDRYADIVDDSVSYPDSKSGHEHYEAEKGEFITSYQIIMHSQYGRSGYSTSKTAANSDYISEQKINETFDELQRYAREQGKDDRYKEELERSRKYFLETYSRVRSSQSRVDVNWSIKHDGNEIDRRGGGMHIGIAYKVVRFLGPDELGEAKNQLRSLIAQSSDLPTFGGILSGGQIVANRTAVAGWETFKLVQVDPTRVAIGSHVGFFSAIGGGGGEVIANRPWIRGWETWTLERNDNGTVSFRSISGHYLCAEGGGGRELVANRTAKGGWEMFWMMDVPGGIALKANSGEYVSVQP